MENVKNQSMVTKQLALIFLDNGYRLGYTDKSSQPLLTDESDYLLHAHPLNILDGTYLCHLTVRNDEHDGYIQVIDDFNGLSFSKQQRPAPKNKEGGWLSHLPDDIVLKEPISVDRAKEVARSIFEEFITADTVCSDIPKYIITKPNFVELSKEDFTKQTF